jgi:hypothetical protein
MLGPLQSNFPEGFVTRVVEQVHMGHLFLVNKPEWQHHVPDTSFTALLDRVAADVDAASATIDQQAKIDCLERVVAPMLEITHAIVSPGMLP